MKKIIFLVLFTLLACFIYAGPFGLEMGMTLEQVLDVCDSDESRIIDEGIYLILPMKKHPAFERYIAYIDEDVGLYYIKAIGFEIEANKYGTELVNSFENIRQRVSITYGDYVMVDTIQPTSILNKPDWWMYTLNNGDREYYCYWNKALDIKPDGLSSIILSIKSNSDTSGYIILEYQFRNFEDVQKKDDSVL